jgi:NAD(P)H-hydrate epimerase
LSPETLPAATALPERAAADLPALTREQMREVDRLMIQEFDIQLLQMMENAGLALAELARLHLGGSVRGRRVVVFAGRGNNGGGGLAAARRLSCWGADVQVILSGAAEEVWDVPALQLGILERMGVPVRRFDGELPPHEIIIDAVIGYSLAGSPRGAARDLIEAANASPSPAISLDAPSGLDVDSGEAPGEAVRAAATLTLALPKVGLLESEAHRYVGQLYLADISVPHAVYSRLGLRVMPPFAEGPLVRIIIE